MASFAGWVRKSQNYAGVIYGWSTRDPSNINDVQGTQKCLSYLGYMGSRDFKNSYDLKKIPMSLRSLRRWDHEISKFS